MPYRRLPTTDAARIRALQAAVDQADKVSMDELAYPSRYIHPVKNAINQLQGAKHQQKTSYEHLIRTNEVNHSRLLKTRMYLSHFIQVLNLAIAREEVPTEARTFYDLKTDESRVPDLVSDEAVFEWGKRIIEGEQKRIAAGGVPMMNPTIGKVKVWYEQFKDGFFDQQTAKKSNQRANQKMVDVRKEVDQLILEVWNEVEQTFSKLPDEHRRTQASNYGVVYIWRKSESVKKF